MSFSGKGTEGQKESEQTTLETALSAMLAEKGVTTVTVNTQSTNSWTTDAFGTVTPAQADAVALYPDYMPVATTTWFYCWDTKGNVDKQLDTSAANDCS